MAIMDAESKESKELGKPVGPWECDDVAFSADRAAGASVSAARGG